MKLFIATATAATALLASTVAKAAPDFTALEQEMAARCADGRYSGVVTVAVAGQVAFQKVCGEGVTLGSRFKIFSTSKLLTALAVMSLVEDGRMALDAPVATYIADLPAAWRAVTVRQLLDHTSGLPDETNAVFSAFVTTHTDAMQVVLAAQQTAPAPATAPGETWRYNNFGYELLAEAAARVEGKTFDQVLEARVLKPAGMADAVVELAVPHHDGGDPSSAPDARLVTGYVKDEDGRREATSYSFVQLGAGAIHATAADLLALERALRDGRVVSGDTWRAMVEQGRPNAPAVPSARYGLGVMTVEKSGLLIHGHTGGTNGYISSFRRVPARDAAIFALSNYGWAENRWIEDGAAAALAADED